MSLVVWNYIELAASVIENSIILYFYTSYHKFKYNRCISYISELMAVLFLSFLNHFIIEPHSYFGEGAALISLGLIIVYGSVFFKGRLFTKVLIPTLIFFLIFTINVIIGILLSEIFETTASEIFLIPNYQRFIGIIVSKLLLFSVLRIVQIKISTSFSLSKSEWCMIIFITLSITFINTAVAGLLIQNSIEFNVFSLIVTTLSAGIIAYMLIMIPVFSEKNKEKEMLNIVRFKLDEQTRQINEIVSTQNRIRILKHDMNNHFLCIQKLLDGKNYNAACEYISKLTNFSLESFSSIKAYDVAVEALLTVKYDLCRKKGITFIIKTDDYKPNCENIDICILLSNLIDNAIEACEQSDRPEISLTMSKQMNYYSIYIENSISNEILKDNPNLITTKKDKSIHGLGTKSIENIVNSYQGLLEYVEENGKFICNILLKDIENK